jgi:hypothetical protein
VIVTVFRGKHYKSVGMPLFSFGTILTLVHSLQPYGVTFVQWAQRDATAVTCEKEMLVKCHGQSVFHLNKKLEGEVGYQFLSCGVTQRYANSFCAREN